MRSKGKNSGLWSAPVVEVIKMLKRERLTAVLKRKKRQKIIAVPPPNIGEASYADCKGERPLFLKRR